jgi:LytS/YehU family sensor histidine kinase
MRMLSEYQMTALRAQIKPHFIFNCISAIQTLILQGQVEVAYEYLQKFSKLLRLVLENSKRNFITLKEELDVIDLYIELEQLRFDGSFTYTKEIDETIHTSGINIPYLILQPVIENAIWHGLLHSDMKEKKLHVKIKNEGKLLVIHVEDNGIGRELSKQYQKNATKRSMGQTMVSERLSLVSARTREPASIEITDLYDPGEKASGTLVTLQIPYN